MFNVGNNYLAVDFREDPTGGREESLFGQEFAVRWCTAFDGPAAVFDRWGNVVYTKGELTE